MQGDRRVDDRADAADAAADDDAHLVGFVGCDLEFRIAHRFLGGDQAKLEEAVHAACFLAIQVLVGVKAFDFTRDAHVQVV